MASSIGSRSASTSRRGLKLGLVALVAVVSLERALAAQDLSAAALLAGRGDEAAIALLRESGPRGMSAFLDAAALASDRAPSLDVTAEAALDRICAQRDCAASRLYWYTDLAAAKAEASRRGVPILSLRLLGRLDEELSCANSRFFRLAVYSNGEVSGWLRDHVVLHWSSERAVPKVRIDFGDGRALEGTVTGNSAHYLLDAQGRPLDVFPGLYSPQALLAALREAEPFARRAASLSAGELARQLRRRHQTALGDAENALAADLRKLDWPQPQAEARSSIRDEPFVPAEPTAIDATALTLAKSWVETPLLEASFGRSPQTFERLPIALLAGLEARRAACDAGCRRLIARRANWLGGGTARGIERFEAMLAQDTLRNEIHLHASIHRWFAEDRVEDFAALNRRVYDELFLSPKGDPWLGLGPREVFSVLNPSPAGGNAQ